jgi:hypothetical protein
MSGSSCRNGPSMALARTLLSKQAQPTEARKRFAMLSTSLFIVASPKFALLMLSWLLGVGLVVSLFLANRRRILKGEKEM